MDIHTLLDQLQIPYIRYEHPAFFSVGDEEEYLKTHDPMPGLVSKNLFLRNRTGDRHYLIVMDGHKRLDIKALGEQMGEKLSFASPERLMKYLKLTPGSVGLLALINDPEKAIKVFIDKDLMAADQFQTHPLINTQTLVLSTKDIPKFLKATGHTYELVKL